MILVPVAPLLQWIVPPELVELIVLLMPLQSRLPLLLPITGAVVVATPQQVALDDAVRAVKMFQQLGAPILGIVENMSYLPLPDGSKHDLFGRGGAEQVAHQLNLPFLGELPMFTELRVNSDAGNPHANYEKNPQLRDSLNHIVSTLAGEVSKRNVEGAAPELTIS